MTAVTFWFDFLSPYSWLAFDRAREFAAGHGVEWVLRPVVFGAILDATGLVGPGEVLAKRNGAMRDVAIQAADRGLDFVGPPLHPFRSLAALRVACLYQDTPKMFDLCRALFAAAWERGRDLTDTATLGEVLESCGESAANLDQRIQDPAIKALLRSNTETAIAKGVYGVPTFEAGGELFWGRTGSSTSGAPSRARCRSRPLGCVRCSRGRSRRAVSALRAVDRSRRARSISAMGCSLDCHRLTGRRSRIDTHHATAAARGSCRRSSGGSPSTCRTGAMTVRSGRGCRV